ncbi:MAG: LysR substrate-binding domain-containing protein, partial [Bowdeniella nasicola]|nr:LysR substrate-binding domain-containing protein [Bowdeniella nasicola]
MNLRDLDYLLALAATGNFSRAAAKVGVSQPTLSTQVRKLEAELGASLVERTPQGVLLTAAGQAMVKRARRIVSEVTAIRHEVRAAGNPRSTPITLGLFPTFGPYILPHLLGPLRAQLPDADLRFVEEKSAILEQQLACGDLDAIVLAELPADESLGYKQLLRENFVLAMPADHPLAVDRSPLPLAALADHELLLLDEGHCLRDQALDLCRKVHARQASFRATSLEALRYMVAAGAGVTLLPHLAVLPPARLPEGMVIREFTDPKPSRTSYLVWRPTSIIAPIVDDIAGAICQAVTAANT